MPGKQAGAGQQNQRDAMKRSKTHRTSPRVVLPNLASGDGAGQGVVCPAGASARLAHNLLSRIAQVD